jgi:hypothetical protein
MDRWIENYLGDDLPADNRPRRIITIPLRYALRPQCQISAHCQFVEISFCYETNQSYVAAGESFHIFAS